MPRTTADLVKEVIEVDEELGSLTPFIRVANQLVTELCGAAGYDDQRLTDIETWLSAHFWTAIDPRVATQFADGVGQTVIYKAGFGLDSSIYGQMVKRLDTKGALGQLDAYANEGKKPFKASISHLAESD